MWNWNWLYSSLNSTRWQSFVVLKGLVNKQTSSSSDVSDEITARHTYVKNKEKYDNSNNKRDRKRAIEKKSIQTWKHTQNRFTKCKYQSIFLNIHALCICGAYVSQEEWRTDLLTFEFLFITRIHENRSFIERKN